MKKKFIISAMVCLLSFSAAYADAVEEELAPLQDQWAVIKYQMPEKKKQQEAMAVLVAQAEQFSARYPARAEPLIWQAIIVSTKAGIDGGLSALGEAKQARDLLLVAEKIDPNALEGSVYTSLGSLYEKVPVWPIGFGSHEMAKQYLEKALALNPDGVDPNFFYGEWLYGEHNYVKAQEVLEHAMAAPARPGRELADQGRREEIQALLLKIKKKMS